MATRRAAKPEIRQANFLADRHKIGPIDYQSRSGGGREGELGVPS